MTGGESTIEELDALTSEFMSAGRNAEFFQQAVKQLSGDLDASRAATEAANAALAAGRDEYSALETAALQAAKAAERAAQKQSTGADELAQLASKAAAADAALQAHVTTLRELEANATGAAREEQRLASTLANVRKLGGHVDKTLAAQAESLEKLGGAMGAVGGPLGALGQQVIQPVQGFAKLAANIGTARAAALLGTVAVVGLAAAAVALRAALAVGVVKVAAWAVGLADSARSADLSREALEAMHPEIAALRGDFDALTQETGLGSSALLGITRQLQAAGVAAGDLPGALRAAALAEKALGAGGAGDFVERIRKGDRAVSDLAAETQNALGGIVARQMLGLETQSGRLQSNLSDLCSGLNIDSVIAGMQVIVGMFDKTSVAGETVRFLFESVFQPLIDQAESAAYVVEAFYLGVLIGATKVYIALKPTIRAIGELFGFEDTSFTDLLALATDAGELFAYALVAMGAAFGAVIVVVGAFVAAVGGMLALLVIIPVKFYELGTAIFDGLVSTFNRAVEFIRSLEFMALGTQLITGLVNGITAGAGAVVSAITGVARGAINAAKSMLGIASPSKVFEEIGAFTGEGFVGGVEAENDNAQAAITSLASPQDALANAGGAPAGAPRPPGDDAPAADGAAGAAAAGPLVVIESGAQIIFQGVKDAPSGVDEFGEMLTAAVRGDASKLGRGKKAA